MPSPARPQGSPQVLTVEARIAAEWDRRPHQVVDWLAFEKMLRTILAAVPETERTAGLRWIDEALAAFTRRGHVYEGMERDAAGAWVVAFDASFDPRKAGAALLGADWQPHQTGGGCMAWRKPLDGGDELLLSSEGSIDVDPRARVWIAGRYSDTGDYVESPVDLTLIEALGAALNLKHPETWGEQWGSYNFALDGDHINIAQFIEDRGFAMPDVEQIRALVVGERITYADGAVLERV